MEIAVKAGGELVTTDVLHSIKINGIRIDAIERGTGTPLLFLHPGIGIDRAAPVLDRLASHARLIAPTHPGFGNSEQPPTFDSVDDLSYFYLDLLDELDLKNVTLVGVSLGGWIAAAMAIKSTARIARLVLANPVGIKVGGRETRDIADIYAMPEKEFNERAYADPTIGARDYKTMAEADVRAAARNREATARYAWSPYMHDPKLKARLHRIKIPTLFLWGDCDRILSEHYGRAYASMIPGARFELVAKAGHFPHLEQADKFARRVHAFMDER
ncbi:MAG: alpha/beta fold hydrolase [Rhizobiales bacterium]|nr:alpha/beta fold hydrolase [Hyphomicrobiales bacterium]